MDYSATFARHFARLVWLLVHETGNIEEQKATLRALVVQSRDGPVVLAIRDRQLSANGDELSQALTGVADLAAQMGAHAVRELHVEATAEPADLLGTARILAAEAPPGDRGRAAEAKLRALGVSAVRFVVESPAAGVARDLVEDFGPLATELAAELTDTLDEPTRPVPAAASPHAAPGASDEIRGADFVDRGGMWLHFSAMTAPTGSPEELFAQLDATTAPATATRLLDDLVTVADNAAREGRTVVVGDIFHGIVRREAVVSDDEVRRAYVMAIRRMSRPGLLRPVATLLPSRRDRLDDYVAVLSRTGEDGADAVIDQLAQAQTTDDRRVLFDVLLHLQAGVPALVHMLGDARWFVVRNAADLLGEMKAVEALEPLKSLFRHEDDRVRRAANNALMALDTFEARKAVHLAIRDESPEVRKQAVSAVAGRKDERSAATLVRALDDETDADLQAMLLAALGQIGSPAAVERLVKAAEPEGRFFRRKSTGFRVAAVTALGEAGTPAARAALATLQNDREREVRDAAARALAKDVKARGERASG